ncbi:MULTISPECIES: response regulator transcription factor [Aurantimonas]|uniref:response regulator transcription factor n=1 Tax=Aurantimonas TaxID=182269 RepID=UPI0003F751D1|nr:response regulator transcription factor [Aurantimonas coralicida]
MHKRIFILEDDRDLAAVFARELTEQGFVVATFQRIADFRRQLGAAPPDLCIVDLGLPDGDGLALLKDELGRHGLPIVIVSGRGALDDRLRGLESGADDYLTKPVEPLELAARIRSVLRRTSRNREATPTLRASATARTDIAEFAGWRADFGSLTLRAPGGAEQPLSRSDAELLRAFLEAQGRVLSRDFLLELFSASGEEAFDRSVDVRVSRLRKKLDEDPKKPVHVRTVYGAGYVFATRVDWVG